MTQLRLKDIREKLKKTQEELSEYLSQEKGIRISRSTIAKYESGVIYPSKRTLKKLAMHLVSQNIIYPVKDINQKILMKIFYNYFIQLFLIIKMKIRLIMQYCHIFIIFFMKQLNQ